MTKTEIPIEQLEKIGLTEDVLYSLPLTFMHALTNGELTPVIYARKEMPNGNVVEMPMKLQLFENEYGQNNLRVYPILLNFKNDIGISAYGFNELSRGAVLHVDGHYIQRDPETNCIITVKDEQLQIEKKIKDIEKVHDIELGTEQKNQIRNGKPVELNVGGETMIVGLDLTDPDRFRSLNGGMKDWEYQKQVTYDLEHPEYLGVVKTDENRWEYAQFQRNQNPENLNQKPKQAMNSGMRR